MDRINDHNRGLSAISLYAMRIIKPLHPIRFFLIFSLGILAIVELFWFYPIRIIDHRAVVFVCGGLLGGILILVFIHLVCHFTKWTECKTPSNKKLRAAKVMTTSIVCFLTLGSIILGLFLLSNPKPFSWFDGNGEYTCYNIQAANKMLLGKWDRVENDDGVIILRFLPDCPTFSKSKQYVWIIYPNGRYQEHCETQD